MRRGTPKRVPAVAVARFLSREADKGRADPGSFQLTGRVGQGGMFGMLYVCPCGCGALAHVQFRAEGEPPDRAKPSWVWDGDPDAPTLTPSINRTTRLGGCGWHGFLTAGVWIRA